MAKKFDQMIAVRLTRQQKEAMEDFCGQSNVSQSDVIREFIETITERKP